MGQRSGSWDVDDLVLEELVVEGDDAPPDHTDGDGTPSRRRTVLVTLAVVAVLVGLVAVQDGGDDTVGPPLTTQVTTASRPENFVLLPRFERDAVLGLRPSFAFEIRVDPAWGPVERALQRQGAVVGELGGGTARWWSQSTGDDGVDLGRADGVFPDADPDVVWLQERVGERWRVRAVEVGRFRADGAVPTTAPPPGSDDRGRVPVPRRGVVVGAVAGVLVVARHADRPSTVRLWDPRTGAQQTLADDAVVLAGWSDRVALRTGDDDLAVMGTDGKELTVVPGAAAGVTTAVFSTDGRYLAMQRGDDPALTVLDVDNTTGAPLLDTDLGPAAGGPMVWADDLLLVAAPDDRVQVVRPDSGESVTVGPVREGRLQPGR